MKIALIGYGKMGHAIEEAALSRGHEIVCRIDKDNQEDFDSVSFKSADVAIEFTAPSVAVDNYRRAFAAGVPVVSGTTGWLEHLPEQQKVWNFRPEKQRTISVLPVGWKSISMTGSRQLWE